MLCRFDSGFGTNNYLNKQHVTNKGIFRDALICDKPFLNQACRL